VTEGARPRPARASRGLSSRAWRTRERSRRAA